MGLTERTSLDEHADKGKKPLVHLATTERRICFREVELRPKQVGDAPSAAPSTTAKSSSVAKKVQSQMDHVMRGSAGPSRRGRRGRKRGLTRPRAQDRTEEEDAAADNEPEAASASAVVDTS